MARQPLIVGAAVALLASCRVVEPYTGAFDVPVAVPVLQPEVGGPFLEPVGLVVNQHGGQVVPLALKQGRFLTDDPTVPFLRGNPLPTGALRVLTSGAVTAPSIDEVTVWVGDARYGTLVRLPWLLDCEAEGDREECSQDRIDGAPVEPFVVWHFEAEAPEAQLQDVRLKRGYTATETWTITSDGDAWWVEGSRSGRQPQPARPGVRWQAESHRLAFTLTGTGDAGDAFVLETDSGAREIDVGGTPTSLLTAPDQQTLAMVVRPTVGAPRVAWFDTASQATTDIVLPADSEPGRISWSEDGALLIADLGREAVWEVPVGDTAPIEHPMPWSVLDVAELDGVFFVVPEDGRSIWRVDRTTGELFDTNAALPGVQGLELTATVLGIESIPLSYRMPELADTGIRIEARSVAVSLSSGAVVFAHEDTGCLVRASLGPRSVYDPNSVHLDHATSFDDTPGGPFLEENGSSTRHVVVNECAGIAPAETWTVRYDEVRQGWIVTGTFSGEQSTLAIEDERYVSDKGEVSFVVRAGAQPSRDGFLISFSVDSGVAAATSSTSDAILRQVTVGVSGDPTLAIWRAGLPGPIGDHEAGDGWYPVDLRAAVIVPGAASNEVGRIDPQSAIVDVGWE